MKPSGESFLEQYQQRILEVHARKRTRRPREQGARQVGGLPPPLWAARGSSPPPPALPGLLLVQRRPPLSFRSIGLRLVFLFCDTQKQGKNKNWHWALG